MAGGVTGSTGDGKVVGEGDRGHYGRVNTNLHEY